MKTCTASLLIFILGILFSYQILSLPCYAAFCATTPSLLNWSLTIYYTYLLFLGICCLILNLMPIQFHPRGYPKSVFGLGFLDFINLFLCVLTGTGLSILWFLNTYESSWTSAMIWKMATRHSGHPASFFLALTLLPISRNAFFSSYLGISVPKAILYHKSMACLFTISSIIHLVVTVCKYQVYGYRFLSSEFWLHFINYGLEMPWAWKQ